MAFPYKHVLLVGATSGIGLSMANHLVRNGVKVTAVGRRKDRLDEFVSSHGSSNASSITFDIGKIDEIPKFVSGAMEKSPDIDCIFLNAGIQNPYNLAKAETISVDEFNNEMLVNYTSFSNLAIAFLPYLQKQDRPTSLIFTSSLLALVPFFPMPQYSASKAALNAFIMCLRAQLSDSNVKIIELAPPLVQSELHDKHMGEKAGRAMGIPADEFTKQAFDELVAGKEEILVGSIGPGGAFPREKIDSFVAGRWEAFNWLVGMVKGRK